MLADEESDGFAPSGETPRLGGMRRLRPLSEAECYARCYRGWDPTVTITKLEPRRPRFETTVSGEELRRRFEERIDARVEELCVELDAAEAAAEAA